MEFAEYEEGVKYVCDTGLKPTQILVAEHGASGAKRYMARLLEISAAHHALLLSPRSFHEIIIGRRPGRVYIDVERAIDARVEAQAEFESELQGTIDTLCAYMKKTFGCDAAYSQTTAHRANKCSAHVVFDVAIERACMIKSLVIDALGAKAEELVDLNVYPSEYRYKSLRTPLSYKYANNAFCWPCVYNDTANQAEFSRRLVTAGELGVLHEYGSMVPKRAAMSRDDEEEYSLYEVPMERVMEYMRTTHHVGVSVCSRPTKFGECKLYVQAGMYCKCNENAHARNQMIMTVQLGSQANVTHCLSCLDHACKTKCPKQSLDQDLTFVAYPLTTNG